MADIGWPELVILLAVGAVPVVGVVVVLFLVLRSRPGNHPDRE